jgi:type III polyketide synthase
MPSLWITGLGSQYPPYLIEYDTLESYVKRFYDAEKPG